MKGPLFTQDEPPGDIADRGLDDILRRRRSAGAIGPALIGGLEVIVVELAYFVLEHAL